jgi:hypothetical protein
MNVPNGSHFGRVFGRSSAENTQDETATPATTIFFAVIFHGRHWQHLLKLAKLLCSPHEQNEISSGLNFRRNSTTA